MSRFDPQMDLFQARPGETPWWECEHKYGYYSQAYVPGGYHCCECETLVWQDLPPAQDEPKRLGYVTASWAWHYEDGKAWTGPTEWRPSPSELRQHHRGTEAQRL